MTDRLTILNDRDLKQAKARIAKLEGVAEQPNLFEALAKGSPPNIANALLSDANAEIINLRHQIDRYQNLISSNSPESEFGGTNELGLLPIIGRIAKGLSQSDLAEGLGWREQQVQRYETELYSSIKLSSFISVLSFLQIDIKNIGASDQNSTIDIYNNIDKSLLKNISARKWFSEENDTDIRSVLRNVRDLLLFMDRKDVSRSYHRRSFSKDNTNSNAADLIWKAGILKKAYLVIEKTKIRFDFHDTSWVPELLSLSRLDDAPLRAQNFLLEHGVSLIVEPGFPGMRVDGAAFLLDGHPIIGLTLRYDRIDNFWFTMLHELGHVFLHHGRGLAAGFFDSSDEKSSNDIEREADSFALEMIFPEIKWKTSSARITEDPNIVKKIAANIGIHEAILFGRIRNERGFNKFSSNLGEGKIRKFFI